MLKYSFLLIAALMSSYSSPLIAQEVNERINSSKAYAANNQFDSPEAAALDATFKEQTTNMLHFYIDPKLITNNEYLFVGNPIGGELLNLFKGKYRRYAKRADTDVFAAAAVKGVDENLYVVRFESPRGQRIELFDMVNERMEHVKTLADRQCFAAGCRQLDSYITDIDFDGRPDLVQLRRRLDKNATSKNEKMVTYKLMPNGEFKRKPLEIDPVMRNGFEYFDTQK